MRKIHLAGNWKLNKTIAETTNFGQALKAIFGTAEALPITEAIHQGRLELSVMPSFTLLASAIESIGSMQIAVGAQNLSATPSGAFTGEVSGLQLADIGCKSVIIGHSERRHIFSETDAMMAEKLQQAKEFGLMPIYCVGETKPERTSGQAWAVVERHLSTANLSTLDSFTIAYEPVWAIGTGENATEEDAQEMCGKIRKWLLETLGAKVAEKTQILYGGSVKPENFGSYLSLPDCDGGLVGGASLKPESFFALALAAAAVKG